MSVAKRFIAREQSELFGYGPRQRVLDSGKGFQRGIDGMTEEPRCQAAFSGGFIDRNDAPDFERMPVRADAFRIGIHRHAWKNLELRLHHLQAALIGVEFNFAVERDILARTDHPLQPGGVEPLAAKIGAAFPHVGAKDLHATSPHRQHARRTHAGDHRGHFAGTHFGRSAQTCAVFIAEREVNQQIFDRLNCLLPQGFRSRGPHAFDKLNGGRKRDHSARASACLKRLRGKLWACRPLPFRASNAATPCS